MYYGVVLTCVLSVDFLVAGNVDAQYWRSCSPASDWYRNYSCSCENCEEKVSIYPHWLLFFSKVSIYSYSCECMELA